MRQAIVCLLSFVVASLVSAQTNNISSPLDVLPCGGRNAPHQVWRTTDGLIQSYDGRCLDVPECASVENAVQLDIFPCGATRCGTHDSSQMWVYSNSTVTSKLNGMCMDLDTTGKLRLMRCNNQKNQHWTLTSAGELMSNDGMCLTAVIGPTYQNPVINRDFPDPSIVKATDGLYYAYSTNSAGCNICVSSSKNLVNWSMSHDAMPKVPVWSTGAPRMWAPDVTLHDGVYFMYFAAQRELDVDMCVGVAKSDNPLGPFIDIGKPVTCSVGPQNVTEKGWAIDPKMFDAPDGRIFLYWGSVRVGNYLRVQELDSSRIAFKTGSKLIPILYPSNRTYEALLEGAWVTHNPRQSNYYFLYYSGNNCCGDNPHYAVSVARSMSPTGPFEKYKDPIIVLDPDHHWLAPGHNCVVTDSAGEDWIFYHSFDLQTKSKGRMLMMDHLEYVNDWPRVSNTNGYPSWIAMPGPVA